MRQRDAPSGDEIGRRASTSLAAPMPAARSPARPRTRIAAGAGAAARGCVRGRSASAAASAAACAGAAAAGSRRGRGRRSRRDGLLFAGPRRPAALLRRLIHCARVEARPSARGWHPSDPAWRSPARSARCGDGAESRPAGVPVSADRRRTAPPATQPVWRSAGAETDAGSCRRVPASQTPTTNTAAAASGSSARVRPRERDAAAAGSVLAKAPSRAWQAGHEARCASTRDASACGQSPVHPRRQLFRRDTRALRPLRRAPRAPSRSRRSIARFRSGRVRHRSLILRTAGDRALAVPEPFPQVQRAGVLRPRPRSTGRWWAGPARRPRPAGVRRPGGWPGGFARGGATPWLRARRGRAQSGSTSDSAHSSRTAAGGRAAPARPRRAPRRGASWPRSPSAPPPSRRARRCARLARLVGQRFDAPERPQAIDVPLRQHGSQPRAPGCCARESSAAATCARRRVRQPVQLAVQRVGQFMRARRWGRSRRPHATAPAGSAR